MLRAGAQLTEIQETGISVLQLQGTEFCQHLSELRSEFFPRAFRKEVYTLISACETLSRAPRHAIAYSRTRETVRQ